PQHSAPRPTPSFPTRRSSDLVSTLPPECSGLQYLESLKVLEPLDLPALGHNSAEYLHLLLETIKLASADRARYTMDGSVPVELLDRKSTRLNSSHQIISYAVF